MQRRSILALAGGAALAAALPAQAQQPKPARIGVLVLANWERTYALFKEALGALGYVEGKNLTIEFRAAQGKPEALDGLAAELVGLNVELIVAFLTQAVFAAKRATSIIPIIMAGAGDPVATGIVASLARPGGNITGISSLGPELASKALELMHEIKPSIKRVAVLANASAAFTKPMLEQLQSGARALRLELFATQVRGAGDYEAAFDAWAKQRVDAVFVQPSLPMAAAVALATRHRLPAFSFDRSTVETGGLLAYVTDEKEQYRTVATLRRQGPEWSQARRIACATSHQIRVGHQRQDRQSARHHDSANGVAARDGGDRMKRRHLMLTLGASAIAPALPARALPALCLRRSAPHFCPACAKAA